MIKAYTTFRFIVKDPRKGSDIIDEKAVIERCFTGGKDKNLSHLGDKSFKNYSGNTVTIGYRRHRSGKTVEFIVENSYRKATRIE